MKKFKNRATITNAGESLGNPSSLPTLGVAPEMSTSLRPGMYDKHENVNDNLNERDGQYMDTGRTPSFDSTGKDITIFAAQTRVAVSELALSVVSCSIQNSQHFSVEPLPSRVVRKASKVGSNIVSDVIAGGASLLEGIHRSRQGEVVGSDKEQMGRLGDMGILSTNSVAAGELHSEVGEKWGSNGYAEGQTAKFGHHPHPSAGSTKGIMKKPTTCPEIQKRSSRSTMNPKMVDPKPSVRFTLDLPPTLDLDLSLSGSGLDIGRKMIEKGMHKMPTSGSWAERTAAALLDKSRDVGINKAHVNKHGAADEEKHIIPPINIHQSIGRDDPPTSNTIGSENATILCPIKNGVSAAEPHTLKVDQILTLGTEPGSTTYLEDLANLESHSPNEWFSGKDFTMYRFVPGPPVSARNSSGSSDSRRR